MTYKIERKSDLSGVALTVRFPENDIDEKALYTIQADPPPFLLPLRYRCIDGEAECTYQLGSRSKLRYFYGSKDSKKFVDFWGQILQPLLDCGDWFLKPFSFVLDSQYLYTDKDGKAVSYLYIPSKQDASDLESLKNMAVELARENPAEDAELQVKALHAIIQDFQPRKFLHTLRESLPVLSAAVPASPAEPVYAPEQNPPKKKEPSEPAEPEHTPSGQTPSGDDIQIDLSGQGGKEKKKSFFGGKSRKKDKKEKKEGGLFFKKKESPKEILLGAAAEEPHLPGALSAPVLDSDTETEDDEITTVPDEEPVRTRFRLTGESALPQEIPVSLEPGGIFTIGRYDVTVGHKQCDFEFEAKTKAVSRRHAVLERETDGGYILTDLDSTAGTFVNGERLMPNVSRRLSAGCRVAFGTAGADYIWEE